MKQLTIEHDGFETLVDARIRVQMSNCFNIRRLEVAAWSRLIDDVPYISIKEDSQTDVYLVTFPLVSDMILPQVLKVLAAIDDEVLVAQRTRNLL